MRNEQYCANLFQFTENPLNSKFYFYKNQFRADMWALLGIWAVQETIDRNNEECATYGLKIKF